MKRKIDEDIAALGDFLKSERLQLAYQKYRYLRDLFDHYPDDFTDAMIEQCKRLAAKLHKKQMFRNGQVIRHIKTDTTGSILQFERGQYFVNCSGGIECWRSEEVEPIFYPRKRSKRSPEKVDSNKERQSIKKLLAEGEIAPYKEVQGGIPGSRKRKK